MKKRKAWSLQRKEEAHALRSQLRELQDEVAKLKKARTGGAVETDGAEERQHQLWGVLHANGLLKEAVETQQLAVASVQSMTAQYQEAQPNNPLYTYVYLPKDQDERRRVLLRLKDDKFARGCKYVLARSRQLDLLKRHFSDSRYEDAKGNFCCERFQLIQFEDAKSLRQVFNAVKFAQCNMEISISESLGHLTLREDYDSVKQAGSIWNCRLISGLPEGLTYEESKAVCAEYFDQHEGSSSGPCAVVAVESIDKDDLHPFKPHERVRKDVSAVIVLTETTRQAHRAEGRSDTKPREVSVEGASNANDSRGGAEKEGELVVAMQYATFIKIHRPAFDASPEALRTLQEAIASWGDVMVQTINGYMKTSP